MNALNDFIIIREKEADEKVGSLFVTRPVNAAVGYGEVLSVGPGKTSEAGIRVPIDLKVGDKVIYVKAAARKMSSLDNKEKLAVISIDNILATDN